MIHNADDVAPRDLLFTTIVEISELVDLTAGGSISVPTLSLVVWRERLKKVLNDGYGADNAP